MLKARHNWRTTICSDEKWFVLEDKQRKCWMADGSERYRNLRQFPQKVMVWGGISLVGSTSLAFITGAVDSSKYQPLLQQHLVPLAKKIVGSWSFQQDNARPPTSAATTA